MRELLNVRRLLEAFEGLLHDAEQRGMERRAEWKQQAREGQVSETNNLISVGIGTVTFQGETCNVSVPQCRLLSCLVGPGGLLRREVRLEEVATVVHPGKRFTRALARALCALARRTREQLRLEKVPLGLTASYMDNTLRAHPLLAKRHGSVRAGLQECSYAK